jgi:hypothetical protein
MGMGMVGHLAEFAKTTPYSIAFQNTLILPPGLNLKMMSRWGCVLHVGPKLGRDASSDPSRRQTSKRGPHYPFGPWPRGSHISVNWQVNDSLEN